VRSGFHGLQVLNHIDSADAKTWRNVLDFDPLAKYDGWSYEDIVVRPAADAIRTAGKKDTKVWFMLSGEMGRSVWAHPVSYLKLMGKYRGSLAAGKRPGSTKVGVALHWDKVCGNCFEMPEAHTAVEYNSTYHATFVSRRDDILRRFDVPMIKRVFEVADAIGISHYAPAPARAVTPGSFNLPIDTTAYELSHFGIDLPALIADPNRDFLFSEVGIGGGNPDNQRAASNLVELATNIHNGIWAVYNVAQDPWRNSDYRDFRRQWFKCGFFWGGFESGLVWFACVGID
jgi:hypothetical protein